MKMKFILIFIFLIFLASCSSPNTEHLILQQNIITTNSTIIGTTGFIPYFFNSTNLNDTNIFYDGTDLGINTKLLNAKLNINTTTASKVGLVVKGVTSQSANLAEWRLADNSLRARITEEGYFSNNRESFTGRVSEGFGEGTSVEGSWNTGIGGDITLGSGLFRATAVGYGASVSANDGTAIGYLASAAASSVVIGANAQTTIASAVVIGSGSSTTGGGYMSIGQNSDASGTLASLAIGRDTTASGFGTIAIGDDATASHTGSIVINNGFTNVASTSANQLIIAGGNWPINNIYFGKGVTTASPTDISIHGTGGSGTDIAGGDITISGGKATGSATGGDILFQTSNAGGTGTTLQSSTTKAIIKNTGFVGIGTTNPTHELHVKGDQNLTGTLYYGALQAQSPHAFLGDESQHTRICLIASNGDIVMQELVANGASYDWRYTKDHIDCINKEVVTNVEVVTEEIERIENISGVIVKTNLTVEKEIITEFEKVFTGETRIDRKIIERR